MSFKIRLIKKQRVYSVEFKQELVSLFEKGSYSVLQLSKLYGVHNAVIYNWIYKFSFLNEKGIRIVEKKQSDTTKVKELEQRIKDLERMIGQKQIKIDFLEKMVEIASKDLNVDLKKNFGTQPSSGSGKTEKG